MEAADPAANTWTTEAPIPIPRAHPAVGTLADGQIIVAGGGLMTHEPLADVELYTPWSNSWRALTPLLQPSAGGNAGDVLYGDWFVVIGGFVGTELQTSPFVEAALVPSRR
jgi:hypothetical protein